MNIAVLMTVFNRKQTTFACLKRLVPQVASLNCDLRIYMVDDGDDMTGIEACSKYPDIIHLTKGTNHLYWCGGMRLAFSQAMREGYDFYFWLNDDAMLYGHAIEAMITTYTFLYRKFKRNVLIAGSFQGLKTNEWTYGGYNLKTNFWSPVLFSPVYPTNEPQQCHVFNGNFVMIPNEVSKAIGNLKAEFIHAAGDYEYAIRARRYGFSCWIAPGYMGTCESSDTRRPLKNDYCGKNAIFPVKVKDATSTHRVHDWILFTRDFRGIWIPIYRLAAILRIKFPSLWLLIHCIKKIFINFFRHYR